MGLIPFSWSGEVGHAILRQPAAQKVECPLFVLPLWYGTVADDFSAVANVADRSHQQIDPFGDPNRPAVIAPWRPADTRFDDHSRVSALVGSYQPNPWGLFDMHGNVAEWTRSAYRPYAVDDMRPPERRAKDLLT